MTLHKLSELSGWGLEDKDKDIRDRPLVDESGRDAGIIKDLAIDLDSRHAVAVVTSMGEAYAVAGLDIEPERVVTRRPPISGGTTGAGEPPVETGGYIVRVIQLG
jgi:hypothetical protein